MWVDELVPPVAGTDLLFDALGRLPLTDDGQVVTLGPADLATLGLIRRTLDATRPNLFLELPRGKHDVAILCGLLARLCLLVASQTGQLPAPGPVVVVGMNTMVQERLRRIRLAGVQLAEGLVTCRMRSDGRLVNPAGVVTDVSAYPEALIYLNTRVGWPSLPPNIRPSVVVIDRTSFASLDILERALSWASRHAATSVIVVADVGDDMARKVALATGRPFLDWPWSPAVLSELTTELGAGPATSKLSMNDICRSTFEPAHAALVTAAAVDETFRAALRGLAEARKINDPWPRPLQLVRRLTYGLAQLLATVDEYNQWAALDHRTSALSTLAYELRDGAHLEQFSSLWTGFGQSRWGDLRLDALKLYDLVEGENPKLYALAYALERVTADLPDHQVVIRVANEAGGHAMEAVLRDLAPEHAPDGDRVRWMTWSDRTMWTKERRVEIHPAAPPPSRMPTIWSAECSYQLYLAYPFEVELLNAALGRAARERVSALSDAARVLGLGSPPSAAEQVVIDVAFTLDVDRRLGSGDGAEIDLDVDAGVLFEAVADDAVLPEEQTSDVVTGAAALVNARPVIVEPDGWWWWIREGRQAEVLVGDKVTYLGLDDLRPGMAVLVPRGEGREELFGRLVAAAHQRGDMQAFEVLFRRWREACWSAHGNCGDWGEVERRMQADGSTVTRQSPRTWATGTVIAPDNPEDIRRIGVISGDKLIEAQYRRLGAMADQVRGLHGRLGRLLSGAMAEALDRGGPSLDALTRLVGTDPSELLDEFDLRAIRRVGLVQAISSSELRRLVPPPS